MTSSTCFTPQRLLLAGGFALALTAAPLVTALSTVAPGAPSASCPADEVLDPATGACKPSTDVSPTTLNPIEPGKVLAPGEITSGEPNNVGSLPEVNGIPCDGKNTGLCIGLNENNNSMPKVTP